MISKKNSLKIKLKTELKPWKFELIVVFNVMHVVWKIQQCLPQKLLIFWQRKGIRSKNSGFHFKFRSYPLPPLKFRSGGWFLLGLNRLFTYCCVFLWSRSSKKYSNVTVRTVRVYIFHIKFCSVSFNYCKTFLKFLR